MISFIETTVSRNNSLCTLSKPTAGNNEIDVGNVFHYIHNSFPESRNNVMWMPIGVPLNYALYVIVHRVNIWGARESQVENGMVMKFFYHLILNCMGYMEWFGSLLKTVRLTTCYRSNPELSHFGISNLVPDRKKCGDIRSSLLFKILRIISEIGHFLCVKVGTASGILHSHRCFCCSLSVLEQSFSI